MIAVLRIGTRASRLAMIQASLAADAIAPVLGDALLVPMATKGDATSQRRPSGSWVDDDGQFTRDLERALTDGEVDLVAHSYKDLPTDPVDGLVVAAVLERADPRDCLVTNAGRCLEDLPIGARVGTSSPRRSAQLLAVRDDLVVQPMRGNVETRLARLGTGEVDALLLAAAGLDRLGVVVPEESRLPLDIVLPAPAQGALAIQVRSEDAGLVEALGRVDHRATRIAVEAERALLRAIGGGCLAPLGTLGDFDGELLKLRAAYAPPTGGLIRACGIGAAHDPAAVVERVAREALGQ